MVSIIYQFKALVFNEVHKWLQSRFVKTVRTFGKNKFRVWTDFN
jgi:hypothetical protein